MSERPAFNFALPALVCLLVAAAVFNGACASDDLGGRCVTFYTDGHSKSVASYRADCDNGCLASMEALPGYISGCQFDGLLVNPVEPRN